MSLEVTLGSLKGEYCANGSAEIYGIFGGRQAGLRQTAEDCLFRKLLSWRQYCA